MTLLKNAHIQLLWNQRSQTSHTSMRLLDIYLQIDIKTFPNRLRPWKVLMGCHKFSWLRHLYNRTIAKVQNNVSLISTTIRNACSFQHFKISYSLNSGQKYNGPLLTRNKISDFKGTHDTLKRQFIRRDLIIQSNSQGQILLRRIFHTILASKQCCRESYNPADILLQRWKNFSEKKTLPTVCPREQRSYCRTISRILDACKRHLVVNDSSGTFMDGSDNPRNLDQKSCSVCDCQAWVTPIHVKNKYTKINTDKIHSFQTSGYPYVYYSRLPSKSFVENLNRICLWKGGVTSVQQEYIFLRRDRKEDQIIRLSSQTAFSRAPNFHFTRWTYKTACHEARGPSLSYHENDELQAHIALHACKDTLQHKPQHFK